MADHVCPWWIGYLLASPLRRLMEKPERILEPYVQPGMVSIDIGCAMGFFSLPMARMVGEQGKVICVDLQQKMLNSLKRRATRAGLLERLELRKCSADSLRIDDLGRSVDFVLLYAVVHEIPDQPGLMQQVCKVLKPGGTMLLAEPSGHVGEEAFGETLKIAGDAGFEVVDRPLINRSHSAVLQKKSD